MSEVAPSVVQDMRYASRVNVLGHPLPGYDGSACVLRRRAAQALANVQATLMRQGYGLMVFDCYRPVRAVGSLVRYARETGAAVAPYHPRIDGPSLLAQGYIAEHSGHSTGLAVDLTLVALDGKGRAMGQPNCGGPWSSREVDMGTGFDCFDPVAGDKAELTADQAKRREILRTAMASAGFTPYAHEWWHFSLPPRDDAERQAFDFHVR